MPASLQKAQLVPLDKQQQPQLGDAVPVHFNPETLKLTYTNNLNADTGSKNTSGQPSQQASNSSVTLAVDLIFDTTDQFEHLQGGADVRKLVTQKIVALFVTPPAPPDAANGNPIPANPCLFLWGTFQFLGLVESYNETLDFFSASGVPLRASVSMSLKESRYKIADVTQSVPSPSQPLPSGTQIGPALAAAGIDPADWRKTTLANGMETPRFSGSGGIDVGSGAGFSAVASAAGGAGFSVGGSADLGTGIAGAFSAGSGAVTIAASGFGGAAAGGASLG
jgi:Contractile injection system tube protein